MTRVLYLRTFYSTCKLVDEYPVPVPFSRVGHAENRHGPNTPVAPVSNANPNRIAQESAAEDLNAPVKKKDAMFLDIEHKYVFICLILPGIFLATLGCHWFKSPQNLEVQQP